MNEFLKERVAEMVKVAAEANNVIVRCHQAGDPDVGEPGMIDLAMALSTMASLIQLRLERETNRSRAECSDAVERHSRGLAEAVNALYKACWDELQ